MKAGIELAVICTHSSTHYDIAKQCLEAGCHVIIEKPVTLDSTEAEELFTIAAERGLETLGGLGMLLEQAAAAYRLWTGRPMPRSIASSRRRWASVQSPTVTGGNSVP